MKSIIASIGALAAASQVAAHGYVSSALIGGTNYTGYLPYTDPYTSPTPQRIIRAIPGNGPVTDMSYADIQCNGWTDGGVVGSSPAPLYATAAAGSTVTLQWTDWPDSHIAVWFKVDEAGLNLSTNTWAAIKLISDGNKYSFTIPASLAPGQYIIRHEIIALHSSYTYPGAQSYPSCIQVQVTGSGSVTPSGSKLVAFPGAYGSTTAGLVWPLWNPNNLQSGVAYPIPGPSLYFGGSSASSTTTAKTSTTTTKASTTTTSKAASSTTTTTTARTSTTTTKASSTTTTTSKTTTATGSSGTAAAYAQCGGSGWTGATVCVSGYTCTYSNAYYSQESMMVVSDEGRLPKPMLDANQPQRRLGQETSSSNSVGTFLSTTLSPHVMGGAVHRVSLERAPDTASVSGFSSSPSPLTSSPPSTTQPVPGTIDSPEAAAPLPAAMASCAQTPTETVYSTFLSTTGGVITITSTQIITGQPSTQTSFSTACIASATDGTCNDFTTQTILTTVPGDQTTSTILQTVTSDQILTQSVPVQTLYAPCDDTTSSTPTKTTKTTPVNSPTPDRNTPTPTPTPSSQSLGQPTTITQIIIVTAPNGQVTTSASLVTQTPTLSAGTDTKGKSAANAGLIAGGVIGGFFGLILLGGLIWFFWKRRQTNWDDIFDKDEGYEDRSPHRRSMNLLENEPKPYEYGVVGAHAAPGPPNSPGFGPSHGRTPSMAPLLLPASEVGVADHMRDGSTSTRSSMRYSVHQSSNNTLSSFSYPPAQSPPFLQTNFGLPQHQRPPSVSASSRNPSQSSRLSYQPTPSPPTLAGLNPGHNRSVSAGQIIGQPRSPPLSETSSSHYSDQATVTSATTSAAPSFSVQRKARPQSYGANAIASSSAAPPAAAAAQSLPSLQDQDVPPPAYQPRPVSKRTSDSIDAYVPSSIQGQRLALTNPDAVGPSPGPSPAKALR
ncbi:Esterase/lipase/thioesterase [Tulasnella sp. 427]|nr:Esterase/lipase/thioesterase [Tulasnella sp. 427]